MIDLRQKVSLNNNIIESLSTYLPKYFLLGRIKSDHTVTSSLTYSKPMKNIFG